VNVQSGVYPQTKWACGSNLCYIGIEVDPRTDRVIVSVVTTIKGQAGQAIQCLNLMMGWDETLVAPVGFILKDAGTGTQGPLWG